MVTNEIISKLTELANSARWPTISTPKSKRFRTRSKLT